MKELIERIECATGPSRELDLLIEAATNPQYAGAGEKTLDFLSRYGRHPKYTASLDAAMTLVLDNDEYRAVFWQVGNDGAGGNPADYLCRVLVCSHMSSKEYRSTAATPALALAAAALKARGK